MLYLFVGLITIFIILSKIIFALTNSEIVRFCYPVFADHIYWLYKVLPS